MRRLLLLVALCPLSSPAWAGKAGYDLILYTPPSPYKQLAWIKDETPKDHIKFTSTDPSTGTYCQIFLIRSTASKGDLDADFRSEWENIIVKSYHVTEPAQVTHTAAEKGWKVKAGVATFAFAKGTSIAMLTTISGYGRMLSIVAVTSSQDYVPAIQDLLGSIELNQPTVPGSAPVAKPADSARPNQTAKPQALQGYMDYNPFTKTWTWKVRYPPTK